MASGLLLIAEAVAVNVAQCIALQMLERISKGRPQRLILKTDNGNALGATLESRLEELSVLRSLAQGQTIALNHLRRWRSWIGSE